MVKNKDDSSGHCKIHNVRFYNLTPRSINYMVYNKRKQLLAVSRHDASIEIWNMESAPYMQKTILGSPSDSIESMDWAGDRLFTTGLTGELIEWDLDELKVKRTLLLTGSAGWCLSVNLTNDQLAIGTEDGYLNLYELPDGDSCDFVKLFDKQSGRILCCRFDHTGQFIVTGSLDTIRIWNIKTGQAIYRLVPGRSETKRNTIVWSLVVLSDFTILAGDSRGRLTVWDGKIGAQLDSIVALKSDVLTVAVNDDETTVCCSGIDPSIKIYVKTEIKREQQTLEKWIKFFQRSVHDHDVKSLVCNGNQVYSGGVDGYLGVAHMSKFKLAINKYGPFLSRPCAVVASDRRQLLLKYVNYLEVWQLGVASDTTQLISESETKRTFLSLEKGIDKLLELRSRNDEPIVCATISPNGKWIIYSTHKTVRVFNFETNNVKRFKNHPTELSPCTKINFTNDSLTMFTVTGRMVNIFSVSDKEIHFIHQIDGSEVLKDSISLITVSPTDKKYFICAGHCRTIAVWIKVRRTWQHYLNLPRYSLAPTAIALHRNTSKLVAAFPDGKVYEYDLDEKQFTSSTTKQFFGSQNRIVENIILDPRNEDVFIMQNDTYLYVLEKIDNRDKNGKDSKASRLSVSHEDDSFKLKDLRKKTSIEYEHLVHISWLTENEIVAVGVNPVTLIEQLPPSLRQKKFGVS